MSAVTNDCASEGSPTSTSPVFNPVRISRPTPHRSRRLVYAAAFDTYVTDPEPLFAPLFLDHFGNWQSLMDLHPTAPYRKAPVRLSRQVEYALGVC